jgi:hypothetical protein
MPFPTKLRHYSGIRFNPTKDRYNSPEMKPFVQEIRVTTRINKIGKNIYMEDVSVQFPDKV